MPDDTRDYTQRYNTVLSPQQEQAYQNWITQQTVSAILRGQNRNYANDTYDYDLRGWFNKNGPQDLTGAHLTDQFKKPNHPTFSDQSQYSGVDGMQGGKWNQQPDGSYSFTPGSTNVYSAPELQDYFKQVEPGNTLNIPPPTPIFSGLF